MLVKSMKSFSQSTSIVTNVSVWRQMQLTFADMRIGFVPTMGHLHAGHLALCQRARQENDIVVASIFVNPKQFNDKKDFDLYPRTLDEDYLLLQEIGIDYLFIPDVKEMYADQYFIKVLEDDISKELEGTTRPGHFNGVLTIILKLLNIIQPDAAYFGEKDYQQLLLIKRMTEALFLPINILGCETVRDENGLALSSRNSRLSLEARVHAAHLHRLLISPLTIEQIHDELTNLGFQVDYIVEKWRRRLAAVWLNGIRLIDNVPWHH